MTGAFMVEWVFKQEPGEPNRWRWMCVAEGTRETLKMSQVPFKTMDECVRDAEKHGYTERRMNAMPLKNSAVTRK